MEKYVCGVCAYVYDPDDGAPTRGVAEETKWADVPGDFKCPVCGAGKEQFKEK